jgi:MATE family multidrug resistance protein
VALAWPLVLTNLTQSLIQSTDVVLLGWAGARTLAAGTLGINLYFAFLIFGIGLVTAAAPMMAKELGARRHSVRDVRRTVRQAMWSAVAICVPVWLILWNTGRSWSRSARIRLAAGAQTFVRALNGGCCPIWYLVCARSSRRSRSRSGRSSSGWSGSFNAFLNYGLIFGKFGLPRSACSAPGSAAPAPTASCSSPWRGGDCSIRASAATACSAASGGSDWQRFREVWRLGLPIAVTLALEITIFNAAVFLMGLIGAESIAAHAIASRSPPSPSWCRSASPGGDGPGRPRLRPPRPRESPAPAGPPSRSASRSWR